MDNFDLCGGSLKDQICWPCWGSGEGFNPRNKKIWPCPHCEGATHPYILKVGQQPAVTASTVRRCY